MKNIKLHLSIILILFSVLVVQSQTASETLAASKASFLEINKKQNWVNSISNENLVSLPVGIKHTFGNIEYSVGITHAEFFAEYTLLTVFCKIDLPQTDKDGNRIQLFFGANNVKLSNEGGIIGDARLVLLGDAQIPFNQNWEMVLYGGLNLATGNIQDFTYATIDCEGFKELKITGAVAFSRDLILPIETNGKVEENKTTVTKIFPNGVSKNISNRVQGEFSLNISSWNDLLINVSLQPFVLKAKQNNKNYDENFEFWVKNATLDLSDYNNTPNVVFPKYYIENNLLIPSINAWRGLYVEKFEIGLPKYIKTTDSETQNSRIYIGANNLIIDKFGVSGYFYGDNIFPLEKGITNKENAWAYSLDHIGIEISANNFIKANLEGQILLPISKNNPSNKKIGLAYSGFISKNEQILVVDTKNPISFDIWKAKAVLLPNSSITLKIVDGSFLPKANLNGTLSIITNKNTKDEDENDVKDNATLKFDGITFQNLQLQTISPIITVQSMGYNGTFGFAGFPVSIGNINVAVTNNNARLDFELGLNLMENIGMSAKARIGINAKMFSENYKQNWKYDGLDLSEINISANFSGFKLNGNLILIENDPIYGKGFSADLDVSVVDIVNVKAKAIFGKSTFRYWYFDTLINLPNTPSPFAITGFGGGAYYKMKRNPNLTISQAGGSGLTYIPDEKMGLGFKAIIQYISGTKEACNGIGIFEMSFNNNGGANNLSIFGTANILSNIPGLESINDVVKKVASNNIAFDGFTNTEPTKTNGSFRDTFLLKAKTSFPNEITGKMGINVFLAFDYDFQNKAINGTLETYIQTPGNFLTGIGDKGKAGWANFYKDQKDWYLCIGTPNDRIGIKLGVAGMFLKVGGYFMTGNLLPASPPPPKAVADILGVDAQSLNYMRNENSLANAGGFAFGADLGLDTGDLSFLILYARFQAGIGFDIMLKNYMDAKCSNTGSNVGINGWYANGQAYAYLQGELGVRVKLLFVNIKVPIITAGAAVLLQAKLPNPFWMQGYLSGNMNVLNGLIKGKFRFKLTIGEECVFEKASAFGGIKLITDVSPKEGTNDVDVFSIPQATFSMRVNENIVIPEDKGDQTYKIVLEKFKVFDGTTEINGTLNWASTKDRVDFISKEILPPNKKLKIIVEVSFLKMENGIFKPLTENGKEAKEVQERNFTTGGAPNYIPLNNIQYAYPIVDQKYFLKDEYKQGYIKLKRGQNYLFNDPIWKTEIKITESVKNTSTKPVFNYEPNTCEVTYNLPELNTEKNYKLFIVSKNTQDKTNNDFSSKTTKIDNEGNDINITENQAVSSSKNDSEIERLTYNFSTSKYKDFTSKMESIKNKNYNFGIIYPDVIYLSNIINSQEPFEVADLEGTIYTDNLPMINIESTLQDDYFKKDIEPVIYKNYPFAGKYEFTQRDVSIYGNPPKKSIPLSSYYLISIQNNVNQEFTKSYFPFNYNLALIYKQDWIDLYNQISNDYVKGIIDNKHPAYNFLDKYFLSMRGGFYSTFITYNLPGNKKTSNFEYQYKNIINSR